jgi:NADPH-dependent 2,4-dienoyl-CoA reductase/sulfur reductase-like enzyme
MPRERLVIIGGVAAGMSAASRARKRNPRLEIVVLEKGQHVSYGTCGLPYFLSGRVAKAEDLIVYSADFFREKREIDVRLEHEAIEIEPGRKRVRALVKRAQPVDFAYDRLVITTGGAPSLEIPGSDLTNVFTCNDLAGAMRLRAFLEEQQPKRAVIIGSGYIGLEVVDAFRARGLEVTVLERSEDVLEGVEPEIGERIEGVLAEHGVRLIKGAAAKAIASDAQNRAVAVEYGAGGAAAADLVLLSTGIAPRVELARAAGFQPDAVTIQSISRAKYFQGKPILLKLIWDRASGRLLGCQMAGEEGIAKRIDVAAMALHARMSIPDMLHLDLSYAPPFAPVWEAILVAANEAHKKLTGA